MKKTIICVSLRKIATQLHAKNHSKGDIDNYVNESYKKIKQLLNFFGIDAKLLKCSGNFSISQEQQGFIEELLNFYSSRDFHNIKKGKYDGVDIDTLSYLLSEFERLMRFNNIGDNELRTQEKFVEMKKQVELLIEVEKVKGKTKHVEDMLEVLKKQYISLEQSENETKLTANKKKELEILLNDMDQQLNDYVTRWNEKYINLSNH